ncbi:MAG: Wzz/FepE/Etk N-terminal domain-containing protein [Saprospiraceae bacterium]
MEILNFLDLIKIIWQNRSLFLKIMLWTTLISTLLSFLLPVYYKSTTTMFPAKSSQVPVTETAIRRGGFSEFGETSESEQALEIINSTRLLDKIIRKYDLFNHYEIDSSEQFAYTRVLQQLRDNMTSKRNKYNSIEISIVDKDPKMAADITNAFPMYYDSVKFELTQSRSKDLLANLERNFENQKRVVDSIRIQMDSLTKYGVMSQFQRGYLLDAYAQAGSHDAADLKKLVDQNIEKGETFDVVERVYERELENMMYIKRFLVQTRADADVEFTQKFVVDKAVPAERKHSPVRWLFVLVSIISSQIFSITALLVRRKWPYIKKLLQD